MLLRECEHFRSKTRRAIGYAKTHQIRLSTVREIRINLDTRVDFLAAFGYRLQIVGRVDLREQRELSAFDGFGFQAADVAIGSKRAIRDHAAHVFAKHTRAVLRRIVAVGHFLNLRARDFAAVRRRAFRRDPFELQHDLRFSLSCSLRLASVLSVHDVSFRCLLHRARALLRLQCAAILVRLCTDSRSAPALTRAIRSTYEHL
ncbi:hypothetical protein HDG32_005328 [Paraburkholderia sp. CI2]|nr:hypothetical protein [Paraburkholderia sp. CI2]